MNPFDFLNSINDTKKSLIVDDLTEKQYPAFMVNRGLSYYVDTVLLANEMNRLHHIDNKLQNDFLINTVRKKKRFSKWFKADSSEAVEAIKYYYGYNNEKARQALKLMTNTQVTELIKKVSKGGK